MGKGWGKDLHGGRKAFEPTATVATTAPKTAHFMLELLSPVEWVGVGVGRVDGQGGGVWKKGAWGKGGGCWTIDAPDLEARGRPPAQARPKPPTRGGWGVGDAVLRVVRDKLLLPCKATRTPLITSIFVGQAAPCPLIGQSHAGGPGQCPPGTPRQRELPACRRGVHLTNKPKAQRPKGLG